MRKTIARSVFALLALAVAAAPASAALIPIGQFQWVITEPGMGQFSVINQTGANEQAPDFPVLDQLLFNNDLNIAIDFTPAGSANIGLADMESPDGGLSWDSAFFGRQTIPTKATLTGTVSPAPGPVQLGGAGWEGLWNIDGVIFTDPVFLGGAVCVAVAVPGCEIEDGQTAIIYVNGERVVPEPGMMLLLGAGAVGLVVRRRLVAKN